MAWPDGAGTYWDSHTKCNSSVNPYVHVRKRNSKTITSAHKDKCLKDDHKKKKKKKTINILHKLTVALKKYVSVFPF